MKIYVTKKYYKRSVKGREPIKYNAKQPKGVGTDVHATVMLDPVLKKHGDLREALLRHERKEMLLWGKGESGCHRKALLSESDKIRRLGGVSGFWREVERRKKK